MKLPKDKKVYVIGMSGLEEELREEGISFIGGTVSPSLLIDFWQSPLPHTSAGPRRQHARAVLPRQLLARPECRCGPSRA